MSLIPTKNQWSRWSLPSKLTALGVLLTVMFGTFGIFTYVVPFQGIVYWLNTDTVPIPGENGIQRQLARAKLEGVQYSNPSASHLLSKFYVVPILNKLGSSTLSSSVEYQGAVVTVSPFKPLNQDIVFDPGRCRLGVTATFLDQERMGTRFVVNNISCVAPNGDVYEAATSDNGDRRLGYLGSADTPGKAFVKVIRVGKVYTVDRAQNAIVYLVPPIRTVHYVGKSVQRW